MGRRTRMNRPQQQMAGKGRTRQLASLLAFVAVLGLANAAIAKRAATPPSPPFCRESPSHPVCRTPAAARAARGVPELDPNAAHSAALLIAGGFAVLFSRRRRAQRREV